MSDAPSLQPLGSSGGSPVNFSADQTAAIAESLIAAGMDPARVQAALDADAGLQAQPSPAPGQDPNTDVQPPASVILSASQAVEMARALLERGTPEAEIRAALAADGMPEAEIEAALAKDTRSDQEREFDATFAPPADLSAYKIDYQGRLPAGTTPDAYAAFDREAKQWLSAVGFSEVTGPAVVERALDAGHTYSALSEPQRQLWAREQDYAFQQLAGGPEQAAQAGRLIREALAQAPAGFTEALLKAGAIFDAGFRAHVWRQAERAAARRSAAT